MPEKDEGRGKREAKSVPRSREAIVPHEISIRRIEWEN
jgi:hypothetical protein